MLSVQKTHSLNYPAAYHRYGSTAFFLTAVIFATTLGRISDSTSPIATLKASLVFTLVSNSGILLSIALPVMYLFFGIGGLGIALGTPGIARFLQQLFTAKNQGLGNGVIQSATGVSTLILAAVIPFIAVDGQ